MLCPVDPNWVLAAAKNPDWPVVANMFEGLGIYEAEAAFEGFEPWREMLGWLGKVPCSPGTPKVVFFSSTIFVLVLWLGEPSWLSSAIVGTGFVSITS